MDYVVVILITTGVVLLGCLVQTELYYSWTERRRTWKLVMIAAIIPLGCMLAGALTWLLV